MFRQYWENADTQRLLSHAQICAVWLGRSRRVRGILIVGEGNTRRFVFYLKLDEYKVLEGVATKHGLTVRDFLIKVATSIIDTHSKVHEEAYMQGREDGLKEGFIKALDMYIDESEKFQEEVRKRLEERKKQSESAQSMTLDLKRRLERKRILYTWKFEDSSQERGILS